MAGILPEGGIAATANNGGLLNADVKEGCQSLFYAISCNRSTFDPIAMNHLLSEVLNVINAAGDEYDCTVKDNLINAITKLASLCAKPNATPDLDDYIAGCFDGVDGKVTVQSIIDLVPFDACGLNTVASHDEDDFVVGCFGGVTGKRRIGDLIPDQEFMIPPPNEIGTIVTGIVGGLNAPYIANGALLTTGFNQDALFLTGGDVINNGSTWRAHGGQGAGTSVPSAWVRIS